MEMNIFDRLQDELSSEIISVDFVPFRECMEFLLKGLGIGFRRKQDICVEHIPSPVIGGVRAELNQGLKG